MGGFGSEHEVPQLSALNRVLARTGLYFGRLDLS